MHIWGLSIRMFFVHQNTSDWFCSLHRQTGSHTPGVEFSIVKCKMSAGQAGSKGHTDSVITTFIDYITYAVYISICNSH